MWINFGEGFLLVFAINDKDDLLLLETWLKSYRPEILFDESGRLFSDISDTLPCYEKRMSASKYANGGLLRKELECPNFCNYGIDVVPFKTMASDMTILGNYVRDLISLNSKNKNLQFQ